jgi:hypothetical protein
MRRLCTALAVACALGAAIGSASAVAATAPAVSDCNSHGSLTRHYSTAELQTALSTMSADVKEYTDCYDVINRTLLSQLGTPHARGDVSSQASGGSFLPTPVIVVLVLLALAAATLGALAIRRRGS